MSARIADLATTLQPILSLLALLSLLTFVLSVVLIPLLIARLPADCFLHLVRRPPQGTVQRRSPSETVLRLVKNLAGVLLLSAGIAMLVLPGQGLLTILLALLLLSFPGRQRLLYLLLTRHGVRHGLNWIRTKTGREPFRWPPFCRR